LCIINRQPDSARDLLLLLIDLFHLLLEELLEGRRGGGVVATWNE